MTAYLQPLLKAIPAPFYDIGKVYWTKSPGSEDKSFARHAYADSLFAIVALVAGYFAKARVLDNCPLSLCGVAAVVAGASKFSGSATLLAGFALTIEGVVSGRSSSGSGDNWAIGRSLGLLALGIFSMSKFAQKKNADFHQWVATYMPPFEDKPKGPSTTSKTSNV